jgi:hypothetical protein
MMSNGLADPVCRRVRSPGIKRPGVQTLCGSGWYDERQETPFNLIEQKKTSRPAVRVHLL